MPAYIYEHKNWPNFIWDQELISQKLIGLRYQLGLLLGQMKNIGFQLQDEAVLNTLTLDVLKSNEIEGEILDADQVRSSIAKHLGMDIAGLIPTDRNIDGVVEVMIDATQNFNQELTIERIFNWHAALFPTGRSGMYKITVGEWRQGGDMYPMQVVSGAMGKEKVHFTAPNSQLIPGEMMKFVTWFNNAEGIDAILKSAIAHLWFVTIHPFDDGNGRLARTIADMQLARADGSGQRFYSMSAQIRIERKVYYDILEQTQKGNLNITKWLEWYLDCLGRALQTTEINLSIVLEKAKFWRTHSSVQLNPRQTNIINRLLNGFDGKLTSSKWAKITKCSHDTALRDINDLIDKNILIKEVGGGRNTSYSIKPSRDNGNKI